MREKPIALTAQKSAEWAELAQFTFLEALMSDPRLRGSQIVFHGGTNLHFSWANPRFSEDLDFLLSTEAGDVRALVERARQRTEQSFLLKDPNFRIELRDKTRDESRMSVFNITVSHPKYVGNTMVKAEFWSVSPEYIQGYPTALRTPMRPGEMVSRLTPIPVASLTSAYADKLTAFATRPYLKMRDVWDLFYIGTQTEAKLPLTEVVSQLRHNSSAYSTVNDLPLSDALREFLKHEDAALLKKAETDLKPWLPPALWERIHPDVTKQMIAYVKQTITDVANAIDATSDANLAERKLADFRQRSSLKNDLSQETPAAKVLDPRRIRP